MSLRDDVLALIRKRRGATELEIAQHLFGPRATQQRVNPTCRELVARGLILRRGSGGRSDPYTYHPRTVASEPPPQTAPSSPASSPSRPSLASAYLVEHGFRRCAIWTISPDGTLSTDCPLPTDAGVYAFARDGVVLYVGVASKSFAKRLYGYGKPGSGQRTNMRLNELIRSEIGTGKAIELLIASPPSLEWNGMLVDGPAGLEAGLIRQFSLPWNVRGS